MMPVVVLRRHKDVFQKAEIDVGVGMNQHRLKGDEDHVNDHDVSGEARDEDGNKTKGSGHKDVNEMQPRGRQPVQRFDRMMDGMEPPQHAMVMKKSVHRVLRQICEKQGAEELQNERPGRNTVLQRCQIQPAKQCRRRGDGSQRDDLDEKMADTEIHQIRLPFRPQDDLLLSFGKNLFERDEDQRQNQKIQDGPVQSDIKQTGVKLLDLDLPTAQQNGNGRAQHADDAHALSFVQNKSQQPE